ncbi:MAG: HAD-IA family hydrolase [Candidatus Paceibacterota bacterium]
MKYKAIVFDYGGVIEIIKRGLTKNITKYLQISQEDWQKVYFSLNYLCNTGKKSYEEVFALTAKELGASDDQISHVLKLQKDNRKERQINLKLIEIIKDLKNKNYKIGLLSNNYIKLRQELIDLKLIDLFDAVVISSEVNYQKPQPEIFEILFSQLSVKKNEVIFIDDAKQSLIGAESIGYAPILFKDVEDLKIKLKDLNVL